MSSSARTGGEKSQAEIDVDVADAVALEVSNEHQLVSTEMEVTIQHPEVDVAAADAVALEVSNEHQLLSAEMEVAMQHPEVGVAVADAVALEAVGDDDQAVGAAMEVTMKEPEEPSPLHTAVSSPTRLAAAKKEKEEEEKDGVQSDVADGGDDEAGRTPRSEEEAEAEEEEEEKRAAPADDAPLPEVTEAPPTELPVDPQTAAETLPTGAADAASHAPAQPTEAAAPTPSPAVTEAEPPAAAAAAAETHKKVMFSQPPPPQRHVKPMTFPSPPSAHAAASQNREATPPPQCPATPPPTLHNTDASDAYTADEAERIAAAAAALTPNTVLGLFRRGGDNSRANRMESGSYSRYLLSTDHMPLVVLNETFHGDQPTLGTVPRNTIKPRWDTADNATAAEDEVVETYSHSSNDPHRQYRHYQQGDSPRGTTAAGRRSSFTPSLLSNMQGIVNWNGTAGSGTLQREVQMLDAATLGSLDESRHHRRRDPRKGKPAQPQLDYVYYNHKSKGFYVPHDPSPDATMLHYNHLYSFGDGTRFAPLTTSPTAERDHRRVGSAYQHNPHAAPPRSFAESRGCVFPLTASQRQHTLGSARSHGGARTRTTAEATAHNSSHNGTSQQQQQQRRRQRAEIQNGTSSLRTAKAIDLSRLHRTQCPKPRTIEEVLADQQTGYLSSAKATHPLVHDIQKDVRSGKLNWDDDVPEAFQTALTAAAAAAASQRGNDNSAAGAAAAATTPTGSKGRERTGSLSRPTNGLVDVMGHLRPVPAIVAATTTRSAASATPTATGASRTMANQGRGDGVTTRAAAPLPAISRLNHPR